MTRLAVRLALILVAVGLVVLGLTIYGEAYETPGFQASSIAGGVSVGMGAFLVLVLLAGDR